MSKSYKKFSVAIFSTLFFSIHTFAYSPQSCNFQKIIDEKISNNRFSELLITSDLSRIQNKNIFSFSGNVKIDGGDFVINSEELNINKAEKSITSNKEVKFKDKDIAFSSQGISFSNKNKSKYYAKNSDYFLSNNLNGFARTIEGENNLVNFSDVSISNCPQNKKYWSISAKNLLINQDKNEGIAEDLVLYLFDVPVFYIPYYEWTISGKSSGFLYPKFSSYSTSNDSGFKTSIPYYINLARDKDLLLTFSNLTSRGQVVNSKYRQLLYKNPLFEDGYIEVNGSYLNKDKITDNKRWSFDTSLDLVFSKISSLKINSKRVSDRDYYKEIEHTLLNNDSLLSNVVYNTVLNNFDISLSSEDEVLINDVEPSYQKKLAMSANKSFMLDDSNILIDVLLTKFGHDDKTKIQANRGIFKANINKNLNFNDFLIKPSLEVISKNYDLSTGKKISKLFTNFEIESSLDLERAVSINNNKYLQTLTPRLVYNYSPYVKQDSIPLFDTELLNSPILEIERNEKFVGNDRNIDANNILFSVHSDFIDEKNFETIFDLNLAQKFYFKDSEINLSGVRSKIKKQSNIVGSANLFFNNLTLSNSISFNPNSLSIEDNSTHLKLTKKSNDFLDISYNNSLGEESIDLGLTYPINEYSKIKINENKSLSYSRTNHRKVSLGFENCCLGFLIEHEKKLNSTNNYDSVVNFNVFINNF